MTTLRKNDLIDIDITGMTAQGAGVGHWEGMAVFTPLTAPGGPGPGTGGQGGEKLHLWQAGGTALPLPGPGGAGLPLLRPVRRLLLPAHPL